MSVASALTDLQGDITAARTAITTKGGTVTVDGGSSQLAGDIATIPTGVAPSGNVELTQQTGTNVSSYATASVRSGSVTLNTPTVNAGGLVTASAVVGTSGWVGSAPAGATLQLSTQGATEITPTESSQTAVTSGKYTTGAVTVNPISTTYVGSGIARRTSSNMTVSGATVTAPAGYYASDASKAIEAGNLDLTAKVSGNAMGDTVSDYAINVTPCATVNEGYYSYNEWEGSETTKYIQVEEKTATPSASAQDITPTSGKLLKKVHVNAVSLTGDATASDVLSGKTFYNTSLSKVTGTAAARSESDITTEIVQDSIYYLRSSLDVSEMSFENSYSGVFKCGNTYYFGATTYYSSGVFQIRYYTTAGHNYLIAYRGGIYSGSWNKEEYRIAKVSNPSDPISTLFSMLGSLSPSIDVTAPAGVYSQPVTQSFMSISGSSVVPTTAAQTIETANKYVTGNITVSAMPTGTLGTVSASKGSVSNHAVSVTPSISSGTAGYNAMEASTGTAVTVSASELVSGTKSITQNDTAIDVTNYASVDVNVPTGTARSQSDVSVSGATVSMPAGLYSDAVSGTVASGSAGTPTASKGTVTNHSVTVTPTVTNATGYITGSTKTGAGVTVSASELVSGNSALTATTSTQTGIDITNYATVSVAPTPSETKSVTTNGDVTPTSGKLLSKVTVNVPTGTARSSSDLTVSGATVNVPAGLYSSAASKSVATGTAGTPSASKGSVSNHSVSVTPTVTNTTGYITGDTKTGTPVTVNASELVSGTKSITANGTGIDVTNYASVDVNVSAGAWPPSTITAGDTPVMVNPSAYTSDTKNYESSGISLTMPRAGTYRFKWVLAGNRNAYGTNLTVYSRLYVNGVAQGTEKSTSGSGSTIQVQDLTLNVGDVVTIWLKLENTTYPGKVAMLVACINGDNGF